MDSISVLAPYGPNVLFNAEATISKISCIRVLNSASVITFQGCLFLFSGINCGKVGLGTTDVCSIVSKELLVSFTTLTAI